MSEPALIRFSSPARLEAAADGHKPARITSMCYGGGLMSVGTYGNVVVSLAGLDINRQIKILSDHENTLAGVIGSGRATVTKNQLFLEGTLSRASEAATRIISLSRDGIAFDASIGAEPLESEFIRAGEKITANGRAISSPSGGLTFVTKSVLREVSILPLGADATTTVAIAAHLSQSGTISMDNTTTTPATQTLTATAPEQVLAAWNKAELPAESREHLQPTLLAALSGKLSPGDFDRELMREELRCAKLELLRASRPQAPSGHLTGSRVSTPEVLQAAFLSHLGHEDIAEKTLGPEATQRGRNIHATCVLDIMKAGLTMAGLPIPATKDGLIKAAQFSTVGLPNILGDAANKVLLTSYTAFPSVARTIAKKLSASDFKSQTGLRLGGDAKMLEVGAAGEIKHGKLAEQTYTYSVKTFGRMFGITRRDIINDDLGAFDTVPQLLGRGAAQALEEEFWKLVLANTGSFFAGGNNNYLSGSDSALAMTGLGDAVEKMRKLTDPDGAPVVVVPKFLVCPPELEVAGDQLYASTNVAMTGDTDATTPSGNAFAGKYRPLVVPHLSNSTYSGYSTTGWYLFGDPGDVAAFGIAFLGGVEAPVLESEAADFNTLGMQWRGYCDFGVTQVDYRGGVFSAGA